MIMFNVILQFIQVGKLTVARPGKMENKFIHSLVFHIYVNVISISSNHIMLSFIQPCNGMLRIQLCPPAAWMVAPAPSYGARWQLGCRGGRWWHASYGGEDLRASFGWWMEWLMLHRVCSLPNKLWKNRLFNGWWNSMVNSMVNNGQSRG